MLEKDKKSIYIIGFVPKTICEDTIEKFRHAELDLISLGFKVYNPLSNVSKITKNLSNESKINNIQNLFGCDAVYILPCSVINESNLELRIAILLDLLVIHGFDKRIKKVRKSKKID